MDWKTYFFCISNTVKTIHTNKFQHPEDVHGNRGHTQLALWPTKRITTQHVYIIYIRPTYVLICFNNKTKPFNFMTLLFPISKLTGQLLIHGQRLFLFPACTFSFFTKFYSIFFEILQCIPPTGANQTGARFFLLENVQNYTTLLSVIMQACIFLYHFEKIY